MDEISIIGIDATPDRFEELLASMKGFDLIRPQRLCLTRGLTLSEIMGGKTFVDPVLGLIVTSKQKAAGVRSFCRAASFRVVDFIDEPLSFIDKNQAPPNECPRLWYIDRLGGWPRLTGDGQSVALIDSGISDEHPLLRRDCHHEDFASSISLNAPTSDMRGHGTKCAGIIAANNERGIGRISVAPNCQLSVGQVGSSNKDGVIATFDFLTLTSWAVHCRRARVISFSLFFDRREVERVASPCIFSWVARRLRCLDKALMFCAAGNEQGPIQQPAAAEWIVAVSAYADRGDGSNIVAPRPDCAGFEPPASKEDLFLGPGYDITTTLCPTGMRFDWGKTSAACAFVAGVAALYFEAYRDFSVNQVLEQMKADAEPIVDERTGRCFKGVRFPGALPMPGCPAQS